MRHLVSFIFILWAISADCFATDPLGIQQALGLTSGTGSSSSVPVSTTSTVSTVNSTAPVVPMGGITTPSSLIQPTVAIPAAATPITTPAQPTVVSSSTPLFDYSINLNSNVFGAQLFTGSFAQQGATQFNPDYMLEIGDQIQVRLWGGFLLDGIFNVDPQGNIFLPQIGPIKVLGVYNHDLQNVVASAVSKVFHTNVYSYANLAAAQPVRIFVGGFVNRPGLYNGSSMDSLLHYLDQAGGIDPDRGSFINVQVKRGEQVRTTVNLYDFLLQGQMPLVQLMDGDIIFVAPRQSTIEVTGLVANPKRFEFAKGSSITLDQLTKLAKPQAEVTHARVTRNTGAVQNIEYYKLADSATIKIVGGDGVEFTADQRPGTITVRVEGEHQSAQEYVLPYGSQIGDLLKQIQFSDRSDSQSIQLYRQTVHDRQKLMLQTSLQSLEASVLTASSSSNEEAKLRKEEAAMILQWVEKAKTIEPNGQVLIAQTANRDQLLLENGDIIKIPRRDGLVLVSGEVLFPNAIAYNPELELEDYIDQAGGYTQSANSSRIIIAHRDGSFNDIEENSDLYAGDEILVLPEVQVKSLQIWKELSQIIYQIAVSTRMITRF
jgi:protein involved in polysaccharide export with SLBB domain